MEDEEKILDDEDIKEGESEDVVETQEDIDVLAPPKEEDLGL